MEQSLSRINKYKTCQKRHCFLTPPFCFICRKCSYESNHNQTTHPSTHSATLILPGSSWFTVDYNAASKALEDVYSNYKKYEEMGKRQGHKIKSEFSYDNMVLFLSAYLARYVPKQAKLVLPQLKKIK